MNIKVIIILAALIGGGYWLKNHFFDTGPQVIKSTTGDTDTYVFTVGINRDANYQKKFDADIIRLAQAGLIDEAALKAELSRGEWDTTKKIRVQVKKSVLARIAKGEAKQ